MSLHTGKLDARIETSVPEAFSDLLGAKAHALGVTKADLVRDLLFLAATGETYSFHVAKDKSAATKVLLADMRDKSGSERGRQ
jgi:hypothetical protein